MLEREKGTVLMNVSITILEREGNSAYECKHHDVRERREQYLRKASNVDLSNY